MVRDYLCIFPFYKILKYTTIRFVKNLTELKNPSHYLYSGQPQTLLVEIIKMLCAFL